MKNLKPMFIAGIVAGTLDGLAAVTMYYVQTGKDPMNVFRFIASGVFGTLAFTGGIPTALAGIIFHYIIAFGWTILFLWLAMRSRFLTANWILAGIIYGIFVWLMMNLVVLPLSLVPMKTSPKDWLDILKGMIILITCIGLPISFTAKKYMRKNH